MDFLSRECLEDTYSETADWRADRAIRWAGGVQHPVPRGFHQPWQEFDADETVPQLALQVALEVALKKAAPKAAI